MKELFKQMDKKSYLISFIITTITSCCSYVLTLSLVFYGTAPFTMEKLIKIITLIFLVDIICLVLNKFSLIISNRAQMRTSINLERYFFNKFKTMTLKQIKNSHTGYIQSLTQNVARSFMQLLGLAENTLIPLIVGGSITVMMLFKQSIVTGIFSVIIAVFAVIIKTKMMKSVARYQEQSNIAFAEYNSRTVDYMENITAVRRLDIWKYVNKSLKKDSDNYLNKREQELRKTANMNISFNICVKLIYGIAFLNVVLVLKNGGDALPLILFYISSLEKVFSHLTGLVKFLDIRNQFLIAQKQLFENFKNTEDVNLIKDFEEIKLKNVELSFDGNGKKIKIPEFNLKSGQIIVVEGESGQGKTTLLNILAGLFPVGINNFIVNGKSVDTQKERIQATFVSQEIDLFDLTLRDNLKLGSNISDEVIIKMIEETGLAEWYYSLENGLDTRIGERGGRISQGQKQRLNLIRGILREQNLIILDEPTSNLDSESQNKIISFIKKHLKGKTCVIVTHNGELLKLADECYIMKNHELRKV